METLPILGRDPGEWVLRGGEVFGAGPATVVVAGGHIVHVGDEAGAAAWIGPRTEVLDLRGKMVLPGFHDAHVHPLLGGLTLIECCLMGCTTREECLAAVDAYAVGHPESAFIRGGGWPYGAFGLDGPLKSDLDRLVGERPVALKAVDGHSLWANSAALALGGIDAATPDPPGGRIERDRATGEPSGTLREWSAMDLVTRRLPQPSREMLMAAGRAFMREAGKLGVTSVLEAMATPSLLDAYAALEERGELTLRVAAALLCEPERAAEAVQALPAMRAQYAKRLLRPGAAKLFLDGVVDAHTAFLLDPYADRPGDRGAPIWPEPDLIETVLALDRERFQLHLHAVGDAAARLALDAFEVAFRRNGRRDARHTIAHLDVLDDRDLPRFRELGVVADLQPSWFFIDSSFIDSQLPFLGARRAHRLYRMRDLLETGAPVACGSDWPFGGDQVTCDPLAAIQVGATRRPIRPELATRRLPGRAVGLAAMLDAYTRGGAYAMFQEELTGALAPGKAADLVVLDRDLFALPRHRIAEARVLLTLFEGRAIFRDPSL